MACKYLSSVSKQLPPMSGSGELIPTVYQDWICSLNRVSSNILNQCRKTALTDRAGIGSLSTAISLILNSLFTLTQPNEHMIVLCRYTPRVRVQSIQTHFGT